MCGKSELLPGVKRLMVNGNTMGPDGEQSTQKTQIRKPYLKPAFRFERVFETQALSCGKIGSTSTQCKLNKKTS